MFTPMHHDAACLSKIGIFSVNFTDPTLPRTPKASARYYAKIVQNDGFIGDQPCDKRAIDGSQGSRFFNYFRFGDIIFYSSSSQIETRYQTVSTIVRKKLCKLLIGPTAWCDKALARIEQCRCMSTNMEMKCGYAVVSAFTV